MIIKNIANMYGIKDVRNMCGYVHVKKTFRVWIFVWDSRPRGVLGGLVRFEVAFF